MYYTCRICFNQTLCIVLLAMFHLWVNFCMEIRFLYIIMYFDKILIFVNNRQPRYYYPDKKQFIVNKINKFNISGFRNTQVHFQRTSKSREPFDLRHMQIHEFFTLICRTDRTPLSRLDRISIIFIKIKNV